MCLDFISINSLHSRITNSSKTIAILLQNMAFVNCVWFLCCSCDIIEKGNDLKVEPSFSSRMFCSSPRSTYSGELSQRGRVASANTHWWPSSRPACGVSLSVCVCVLVCQATSYDSVAAVRCGWCLGYSVRENCYCFYNLYSVIHEYPTVMPKSQDTSIILLLGRIAGCTQRFNKCWWELQQEIWNISEYKFHG